MGLDSQMRMAASAALMLGGLFLGAPRAAAALRLPLITVHLAGGVAAQLLLDAPLRRMLAPAHETTLGIIVLCAGSEILLGQLVRHRRAIFWKTLSVALVSLGIFSLVGPPLLERLLVHPHSIAAGQHSAAGQPLRAEMQRVPGRGAELASRALSDASAAARSPAMSAGLVHSANRSANVVNKQRAPERARSRNASITAALKSRSAPSARAPKDNPWLVLLASWYIAIVAVARSPSSAIAVVRDLRASGPFTHTMMSVTMLADIVVIVLFGACGQLTRILLHAEDSDARAPPDFIDDLVAFVLSVGAELAMSLLLGLVLAAALHLVLLVPRQHGWLRTCGLLAATTFAFAAPSTIERVTGQAGPQPMLACILAGFYVANYLSETSRKLEEQLQLVLEPASCFFFFTTGLFLHLRELHGALPLTLSIFAARLLSLCIGSTVGSAFAGAPRVQTAYGWMSYVTQAGVSMGLARQVGQHFPVLGRELESVLVSVVVINQIVGPPMLEHALRAVGEAGGKLVSSSPSDTELDLDPSDHDSQPEGAGERLDTSASIVAT